MTITAPALADQAASTPPNADAVAHFAAKLRFETDPSDVRADQLAGVGFTLVDVRGDAPWAQGRLAGAIHIPHRELAARAAAEIPADRPVVVYCWGPACNGGTRGALALATLGYEVREMIGGFEYWAREGLPTVDDGGAQERRADGLTTVVPGAPLAAASGPSTALADEPDCDC